MRAISERRGPRRARRASRTGAGSRATRSCSRTGGGSLEAEATYLAPVEPSKIVAVHLSYRSRIEEYRARIPDAPSYFMKPPSTLNGHRGRHPAAGRRRGT